MFAGKRSTLSVLIQQLVLPEEQEVIVSQGLGGQASNGGMDLETDKILATG